MTDEKQDDNIIEGSFASQAEALKELIRPYNEKSSQGIVNKDLKLSNLTDTQQRLIVEMTDVAMQCSRLGAIGFAWHLIELRDTMLCSASSIGGFERKMQVSTINIHKLPPEMKDRLKIFNTKDQNKKDTP